LEPIKFAEHGNVQKFPKDVVVVLDPVNVENNVSKRLTDVERKEIVQTAERAWEKISTASFLNGKGETLERWKDVFGRSFVIEA
jgi:tRNA nucleotidyltransferase (CCA-adding enzyme)